MRYFVLLFSLVVLAGCQTPQAKPASSQSTTTSSRVSRHKPATPKVQKAKVADILGHSVVATTDPDRVLQFTASTSGYFMDVQTRQDGQDFATSDAGIFGADITVDGATYTVTGQAQPHATSGSVSFLKRSATTIQQLPNGPTYRRVKNDDLSTLN